MNGYKITANQSVSQVKISAIVRRNYGKVEIELGAEVYINSTTEGDISRAYRDLYDLVQGEHRQLVEDLSREKPQQNTQDFIAQNQVQQPELTPIIDVVAIDVETKGGKRYYKVRGGEFNKWGVRLWADPHITNALQGIVDLETIEDVWTPPASVQLQAKIEMRLGKPQKVLSIEAI